MNNIANSAISAAASLRNEDRQRIESHEVKIGLLERATDVVKTDVNYIRLAVDEIKHDVRDAKR